MSGALPRVGTAYSTLVAASAAGRLAALLVAADAAPQWAESAPQCTLAGERGISATRSEVPLQRAGVDTGVLLLLDVVDLEVCQNRYSLHRTWLSVCLWACLVCGADLQVCCSCRAHFS